MLKEVISAAAIAVCAGCATQSNTTLVLDSDSVGAYVLGVQPEGTLPNVYPDEIKDWVYHGTFFANSNFTGNVNGGYLVRTAKAGKTFGLIRIVQNNIEAATAHIRKTYPEYTGPIQYRDVDYRPTTESCSQGEPIQIFM